MRTSTYLHACAHTRTHLYTGTCTHMHIGPQAHTQTLIYICTHRHIPVHAHTGTYTCMQFTLVCYSGENTWLWVSGPHLTPLEIRLAGALGAGAGHRPLTCSGTLHGLGAPGAQRVGADFLLIEIVGGSRDGYSAAEGRRRYQPKGGAHRRGRAGIHLGQVGSVP